MNKMRFETPDLALGNIDKIAALFPNVITETKDKNGSLKRGINFELLKQMLAEDVVEGKEAYEFTWVGKKSAIREAHKPIRKTLRPCPSESVDWDTTQNLYIEGDNLEVLKLLQESYLGKVKMIYIDPPYNTGNDFIYEDDFKMSAEEYAEGTGEFDDEGNRLFRNTDTNGRFHSDWCSMMYSRLLVARNLLADDGVIFISIDDSEATNLRKICDEIYGASNMVGQITVVSNPRGRDYGGVARMHEYILCYRKSEAAILNLIKDEGNEFSLFDKHGGFELRELRNRNVKFNKENRPNLYYPFYVNPETVDSNGLSDISLDPVEGWVALYPLESQGINTVWRWGREKARENLNVNIKGKRMRNGSFMIVEKYREAKRMARSVWWDKESNTEKGTILLKTLLDGKVFDYPKPVELIARMLEMGSSEDCIVLDFFSGSATTAHAVMQLNHEDGGTRRFIMVQLPEACAEESIAYKSGYKTICEIGKERIRRAGTNLKAESTDEQRDTGFRVLKVDSTNMKNVYYSADKYSQEDLSDFATNIKEDRSDKDLLFQCLLEWGLPLSLPYSSEQVGGCTIHNYNNGDLIACFEKDIPEDVIRTIAGKKPLRAVFRDNGFEDDSSKINVEEIFKLLAPSTTIKVI